MMAGWGHQTTSREALPLAGKAQKPCDALGPHLILPLAGALELDHPVLRRPEAEVSPVLAVLQQVPPWPRRDVLAHVDHHTCINDQYTATM
jgi:hypothetical protein